ncbi:MAG: putative Ig domain-containing protein [Phycisphaerales bacterium]|nr:putative Ig domain-containing protein [Phycisphaerales bacterium]
MRKSALVALFVLPMIMLTPVSLAQSSAPGASGPASTTRWADVEARTASVAARLAASPIVQDERRLSDTPDLISADKARWKQIEAAARAGALGGASPPFDRSTLNEDANAFFDDRAAPAYAEFNGVDSNGSRPSDTHLAVGCTHIGVVTNTQFAFYLKNGTVARGPTTFAAWWADSPLNLDLYDPKIIYDPFENRWLMMALNGRRLNELYWAISISKTSDPTGDWWTYFMRSDINGATDTALWCDFPGFAVDSGNASNSSTTGGGIYIGGNMYTAGDSFQYAKLRVLRKYQMYSGAGVSWWDFWDFKNDDGSTAFTVKPVQIHTATASPTMYVMNTVSGGASWVTKRTITNPLASGPSLTGPTQINVATYDTPPDAKQNGTTDLLDTGDCRTQDPWYASGSIYLCHGNTSDWGTAASIEAVVRSYRINSASNAVTWTSDFGQDTVFYFHPAIAANSLSEAYIVFTASGDDRFAQTRHSGRQPADGSMQGSSLLHTSTTFYNPTGSSVERWGDYSGMAIDPNGDERGAWLFNQYSDTTTTWSTRIGGISFGLPSVRHLASGSEESYSAQERYFTFNVSGSAWTTIGIDKTGGAADDDADIAASNSCGFSPYQNATLGNTVTDFIAANGIDYGASTHTARVYANSGTLSSYRIETRAVATTLNPTSTSASAGSFIATDLLDNYQASVVNGKTYAAVLDITGNTANYDLFRFASTRLNGRRFVNDGESDSAVNGATETILFTAGATGTDGFVVVNNNAVAGDYTMRLFLKPLVSAVGTVNPCSASLMTYPMSLVEGTSPTWSFTTAVPAGMVINSTTGVISWPVPRAGLYNVTVRATNPAGFDDEALTFRFDCAADFNCDNQVDDADFVLFLAAYNILVIPPANPKFDLTNDGLVEDADFQIFIQQYDDLVCP